MSAALDERAVKNSALARWGFASGPRQPSRTRLCVSSSPLICGNRTNAVVASLPGERRPLSCFSAHPLNDATGAPASWHSSKPAANSASSGEAMTMAPATLSCVGTCVLVLRQRRQRYEILQRLNPPNRSINDRLDCRHNRRRQAAVSDRLARSQSSSAG